MTLFRLRQLNITLFATVEWLSVLTWTNFTLFWIDPSCQLLNTVSAGLLTYVWWAFFLFSADEPELGKSDSVWARTFPLPLCLLTSLAAHPKAQKESEADFRDSIFVLPTNHFLVTAASGCMVPFQGTRCQKYNIGVFLVSFCGQNKTLNTQYPLLSLNSEPKSSSTGGHPVEAWSCPLPWNWPVKVQKL